MDNGGGMGIEVKSRSFKHALFGDYGIWHEPEISPTYLQFRPSCYKIDLVEIPGDATKCINLGIGLDGQKDGKIAAIIW